MEFPIIGTSESIPYELIAPHEEQAIKNHGQTLQRLAERGGLDWIESLAVLEDREFKRMSMILAKVEVLKIVSKCKEVYNE